MALLSRATYYDLPLTKEYVRHWGMAEAVREIIQNALDSSSPFQWELEDGTLSIHSRYARLEPSTLLLGSTSKADKPDAIGSFGEGYKIALLVLTRLEYPVQIRNNEVLWEPMFRPSKQFGADVLSIKETAAPDHNQGVSFVISGMSESDMDDVRDSCLQMQKDIGETISTKYGYILLDRPKKLYVNGLFICDTDLTYGYSIKPEFISLERDRQTVSSFELSRVTKNMWFDAKRPNEVAKMIQDGIPDMYNADLGTPDVVKEACYKLFKESHPGCVVASSQQELEQLVRGGLQRERVVYLSATATTILRSHKEYRDEVHEAVKTPQDFLREFFSAQRGNMHRAAIVAFKEIIEQSAQWRVK